MPLLYDPRSVVPLIAIPLKLALPFKVEHLACGNIHFSYEHRWISLNADWCKQPSLCLWFSNLRQTWHQHSRTLPHLIHSCTLTLLTQTDLSPLWKWVQSSPYRSRYSLDYRLRFDPWPRHYLSTFLVSTFTTDLLLQSKYCWWS